MDHKVAILNLLLDRYERSGHCLPGKTSNRRIALSMGAPDYPAYRDNDPEAQQKINAAIQWLADGKLVSFAWRRDYEDWLVDRVYLNLDRLADAYAAAGRVPLSDTAQRLSRIIRSFQGALSTPWKRQFLNDEYARLQSKLRPSNLLPKTERELEGILQVLAYTEGRTELMRVISANCFQDSKYLEQHLLGKLASIARAYEPELVRYEPTEGEGLPQSAVLEQIGILTYPEIFEFQGSAKLLLEDECIDIRPFQKGFCLQSENLGACRGLSLDGIRTVLFVENRTNYRFMVLHGAAPDRLCVYHGGFYSPARRRLFQMIAAALPATAQAMFWGDIDLGGFLMYTRLKRDLFPGLLPFRMDVSDYLAYRKLGMTHSESYFRTLAQKAGEGSIDPVFQPVINAILANGRTVEQEIMLSTPVPAGTR